MADNYLGLLDPADPLHPFLARAYRQVLGQQVAHPVFDVFAADAKGVIYRYVERSSGVDVACKFYGNRRFDDDGPAGQARIAALLWREFANLQRVWALGLNQPPYRVVRPLAVNPEINYVLVEEFAAGPKLDDYLKSALHSGDATALRQRLGDLAGFLAALHGHSQSSQPVDQAGGLAYLAKVIGQLAAGGVIDADQRSRLERARDCWAARGTLQEAPRVLVHGDITPVNLVFGGHGAVIAIDLERLHEADAARDVGMLLAELRHAYFRTTGDADAAAPLAEHVLCAYSAARGLTDTEAASLRVRCRFYIGTMLLRISRNDWLDMHYRQLLSAEGERWLTSDT